MRKTYDIAIVMFTILFSGALILAGSAAARQNTPSNGQQTQPAGQSAPSGSQDSATGDSAAKAPVKKTPPATAAKTQDGAASKTAPASGSKTAGEKSGTTHRAATSKTAPPLTLTTDKDKNSYAIGMNMGKSVPRDLVDVDPAIVARGLQDALAGGKTLMTADEAKATMVALQTDLRKRMQEKTQAESEANKKAGEEFLAANKDKEGVVTLPSGLQYKILTEGTGPQPTAADTVVCNYRGTLVNGTEFDSSYKRGQPATFPVSGVIKGWTEALQLMPVGSKWQLFIPSDLGYGPRGQGREIGPNSALIFEVELLSIKSQIK
jgi:FKBP-type peptidyl-prolyl cis-trans isomerase FklB